MKFISYAQNFEDVMLHRALGHIEAGFYVDVGAQHPINDSVTKAFYDRGWSGINIEPVDEWFDLLVSHRARDTNLKVLATSRSGSSEFFQVKGTGLSTTSAQYADAYGAGEHVVDKIVVAAVTLDVILDKFRPADIHFLKVDVEGEEANVLKGLDLIRYRPWVILVEAYRPKSTIPDYEEWEQLITGCGYDFVYDDGLNRFYVAREHEEIVSAFAKPPNVFDDFETYEVTWLKNDARRWREQCDQAREALDILQVSNRMLELDKEGRAQSTSIEKLIREVQGIADQSVSTIRVLELGEKRRAQYQSASNEKLIQDVLRIADQAVSTLNAIKKDVVGEFAQLFRDAGATHRAAQEELFFARECQGLSQQLFSEKLRGGEQARAMEVLQGQVRDLGALIIAARAKASEATEEAAQWRTMTGQLQVQVRDLEASLESALAEASNAVRHVEELRIVKSRLQVELHDTKAIEARQGEIIASNGSAMVAMKREAEEYRLLAERLADENKAISMKMRELSGSVDALTGSWSWRITSPLRLGKARVVCASKLVARGARQLALTTTAKSPINFLLAVIAPPGTRFRKALKRLAYGADQPGRPAEAHLLHHPSSRSNREMSDPQMVEMLASDVVDVMNMFRAEAAKRARPQGNLGDAT